MKYIQEARVIETDDAITETWKRLRYYYDVEFVSNQIIDIHEVDGKKHNKNIKKQANQISYSIRQAEEYFKASRAVSLATRPTLLYYGAVCLCRALILLKSSGDYSIDKLRKEKKHRHHGLDLITSSIEGIKEDIDIKTFLSKISCEVHYKIDLSSKKEPWGHFPLYYKCLIPAAFANCAKYSYRNNGIDVVRNRPMKVSDIIPLDSLQRLNLLNLVEVYPDLEEDLLDASIKPMFCPGTMHHYYIILINENSKCSVDEHAVFDLYNVPDEDNESLMARYMKQAPDIELIKNTMSQIRMAIKCKYDSVKDIDKRYYFEMIDNIKGINYFIINPNKYVIEPASFCIVLYCLGMMSRYFADIWMRLITNNIKVSEFINTLLNVINKKMPNLILDQMSLTKYTFREI